LTGVGLTTTILGLICVFCLYSFYLKIFKVPSVSSIIEHELLLCLIASYGTIDYEHYATYFFWCRDAFVQYWVIGNKLTMDIATQMYTILKQPDIKFLTQVICFVVYLYLFSFFSSFFFFFFFFLIQNVRYICNIVS